MTAFQFLSDKPWPTGRRPLLRASCTWEHSIQMNLKESGIITSN